jgi:thiol:disulfide interchange protein DsbD
VDRTGHEQAAIDRVMRLVSATMLVAGVVTAPITASVGDAEQTSSEHLRWQPYNAEAVAAARAAGSRVIIDFYADWCAPCKELEEKTFAAPTVRAELEGYQRFKVDLTRASEDNEALTRSYGVRGVPTVIVFEGEDEAFRITGFEPPEQFLERLKGG